MATSDKRYKALVFGASGLIGRFVTEYLTSDQRYGEIVVFVREKQTFSESRVTQVIVNPMTIANLEKEITGDHLYCCIGTTIKKAGSREKFYEIDHNLVFSIAEAAKRNHVHAFSMVSSIGASPDLKNFYLRTKGEIENSLQQLHFPLLTIMRPSMLLGLRHESRPLEDIGKFLGKVIQPLMLGKMKKYRPIHAATVAKAMVDSTFFGDGIRIYESDEIEKMGNH